MQDLHKTVDFIIRTNWLLLFFSGVFGTMVASAEFALGLVLGGLIAAVNFHLLKNTLKTMFDPEVVLIKGRSVVGNVLMKYYIRFAVSGFIIFLLISKHIVHPLGLIAGLSVVVASMFIAAMIELTRLFFKEAI